MDRHSTVSKRAYSHTNYSIVLTFDMHPQVFTVPRLPGAFLVSSWIFIVASIFSSYFTCAAHCFTYPYYQRAFLVSPLQTWFTIILGFTALISSYIRPASASSIPNCRTPELVSAPYCRLLASLYFTMTFFISDYCIKLSINRVPCIHPSEEIAIEIVSLRKASPLRGQFLSVHQRLSKPLPEHPLLAGILRPDDVGFGHHEVVQGGRPLAPGNVF